MNEADWLVSSDTMSMLQYLQATASERKLHLFAVACCRRIWSVLRHPTARNAVELAEQFADGMASKEELDAIRQTLQGIATGKEEDRAFFYPLCLAIQSTYYEGYFGTDLVHLSAVWAAAWNSGTQDDVQEMEQIAHCRFLHDLFGNPFRPVFARPVWLQWHDGTVPKMAQAIYDDRTFDRLPILADALEEAGCSEPAILEHCRQPGEHVRGCWVVDLLLGKE